MSKDGVQYAGEYQLLELRIMSPNGKLTDLKTDMQIVEINLFESIFKNSITGSVIVVDIENYIAKLPIIGQESMTLKLATPSLKAKEDIIDFTQAPLFVHKVNLRTEIANGAQTYEIQFVSPELILNNRKKLSKSYVKTKSNVGDMVKDVLKDTDDGIQTNKKLFLESTIGTRKIVVPNTNPFTFISRLSKEAVSASGSPHYLFFENKNGYHFRTIQQLFNQPKKAEFNVGEEGLGEKLDKVTALQIEQALPPETYKRAIAYSLNIKKDLMMNATNGMIGGKVIEHNLFSKKLETKTFNYLGSEFEESPRIDSNRVYSTDVFGPMTKKLEDEITNANISFLPV